MLACVHCLRSAALYTYTQELLCKAHTGETDHELTRLQSLMSVEEAELFQAARCSFTAFERWRLNTWATRRGVKRRLAQNTAARRP